MADAHFERDVLQDLQDDAAALGDLVKDERPFHAAYEAYRKGDRNEFRSILDRLRLIDRCRLICEWIGVKECAFVCLELCGPPRPIDRVPNPRDLAEAIVKLTSDAQAVKQLAEIIEKRDRAGFGRLVEAYKLEALCHFFCYWVCHLRFRLLCRWFCTPSIEVRPSLVDELQAAGRAMRVLLERRGAFDEAVTASNAGDAEKLSAVIAGAGLVQWCYYICLFFCSWHCVLVCLRICRQFPLEPIADHIKEAAEFARAIHALAQKPAELSKIAAAVGAGDDRTFAAIVGELRLQRFCLQLCHWLCFRRCRRFCIRVCPPIFNHPWFTHVGDFDIYADIDPGTGLTNKSHSGHGGPNYGFFGCLKLRGFCPKTSPAFPGAPMAYRFLFQQGASTTPISGGFVCEVLVGSRYTFWNGNPFALQSVRIRGTGATSPTPPPPGPGMSPPDHFIVPDGQGWITVDPNALDDGFNGWLNGFASGVGFPVGNPTPAGLTAGNAVAVADRKNGVDAAIIFQATRVSTIAAVNGGAAPDYTNQLSKIRINNWSEVMLLDILQFHSGGGNPCSPLSTDLDIEYTVDHELEAAWSIEMITAASIMPAPVFPSGTGPRGAAGTDHHNISTWPTCSYAIRLHSRRSLTDGLNDDTDKFIEKTFCIGRRGR